MEKCEEIKQEDKFNAFVHPEVITAPKSTSDSLIDKTVAVKDNIAIKGIPLTCASKILEDFISPYNATVINKLLDHQATIIGHTNMDEFGMGSSSEHSVYGPVLNPWDTTRVAGGSSGGSAVAVAAGICDLALGSDTGGSVRQPAAFCGVYGYKPTYGRISRYGLVAFVSSMDQIGVMGKNVADVKQIADLISGRDEKDSTTIEFSNYGKNLSRTLKIGIPEEYLPESLHPDVLSAIKSAENRLGKLNYELIPIQLPLTDSVIPCYTIISMAEASSNLARFCGGIYGFRKDEQDLEKLYVNTRTSGFGDEVRRRILLGSFVLSIGNYVNYYLKAQKVRRLILNDFNNAFEQGIDLILTPTTPTPAFKIGEKRTPVDMYYNDVFTASANLAGLPALTIPFLQNSLPTGVQLIARAGWDDLLFEVAAKMGDL